MDPEVTVSASLDLVAEVAAVRQRVEAAVLQQARVEAEEAAAVREVERLLVRLSEEFGVSSLEEAEALLVSLEREVREELGAVLAQLEAAGEAAV